VPLDQPGCVVGVAEGQESLAQFLNGLEGVDPEEVLLEGSDEVSTPDR
jgi:ribosomal protein L12E/L44/L45/RPP1/RPP2